jgi:hypothetical protein
MGRPIGFKLYGVPEKLTQRLFFYGLVALISAGSPILTDKIRSTRPNGESVSAPASDECHCSSTIQPQVKEIQEDVKHLTETVNKLEGTMTAFMSMQGRNRTSIDVPGGYDSIATLQTNLDSSRQ